MLNLRPTTEFSPVPLESILMMGEEALDKATQAKEVFSLGNLRGGTAGCVAAGEVVCGCHRHGIARAIGLSIPSTAADRRFFEAGRVTEDVVASYLAAGYNGTVKAEEDAAVSWNLDTGRKVTGRADFLLHRGEEKVVGVELKTIVSYSSAMRVKHYRTPDPKHLAQAAMYMWQNDCPWILTYVSVAKYNYDFRDVKTLKLSYKDKLDPYRMHFYLRLEDGDVIFRDPVDGTEHLTTINIPGIKLYYEVIDQCIAEKKLYLPPSNCDAFGLPMPWDHVKYCKYCTLAEEANGNWELWTDLLTQREAA